MPTGVPSAKYNVYLLSRKGEAFRNTEWEEEDFRYMHGGDWQGIIDKLDYIKGMGYTAIWLSPVSDPQLWGMPDGTGKQWPTVFQGTEQELGNKWGLSAHGGISDTCNRWNMVEKDFNGKVVADHFNTNTSTYKLIANLNNIRKDHPTLQYGTQREMWTSEHLYAFSRRIDDADSEVVTNPDDIEAICAFNNSGEEQSANMSIRKESSIKPGTILVNVFDKNDKVKVSSDGKINVRVPGYSNKIYVVGSYDPVETVSVSFKIKNAETYWGQDVYLVGNCPELGNWDANGATVKAICPDYPTWEVTVELPKNSTIEFKAIKKDCNGNVQWEGGDNKVINVGEQDMNYEFDF